MASFVPLHGSWCWFKVKRERARCQGGHALRTILERPVRQLVDDCFARAERSRHQSDASHDEQEQHGRWRRVPSPVLALVQCPWQIQLPSASLPFTVSAMYSPRVTLPLLSVKRCR